MIFKREKIITKRRHSKTEKNYIGNNKMEDEIEFFHRKQNAFDAGKKHDKPIYISRDVKPDAGTKAFGFVNSYQELAKLTEVNNNLHEIIKETTQMYSYGDCDSKSFTVRKHALAQGLPSNSTDNEIFELFKSEVYNAICDFRLDNTQYFEGVPEPDLVWLDASRKDKFSKHFINKSMAFENQKDCEIYHRKFREYINSDSAYQIMALTLDQCVYDKDRAMRMVNQSKLTVKEPHVLTIESEHDIEDTFVCSVTEGTLFFKYRLNGLKNIRNLLSLLRPKKRWLETSQNWNC